MNSALPSKPHHSAEGRALSRKRWLDILGMSCVAAALIGIVFLLDASRRPQPGTLSGLLQRFLEVSRWFDVAGSILLVALGCHYAAGRYSAYFGLKHFFRYPPIWVAGVAGTWILFMAAWCMDADLLVGGSADPFAIFYYVGAPPLLLLLFAFCVGAVSLLTFRLNALFKSRSADTTPSPSPSEALPNAEALLKDWDRLEGWIKNDKAITTSADDRFNHLPVAKRIAKRLLEVLPPTQVVLGELGSGKTTLLRLVEDELRDQASVHIVPVELWPYETPSAAVEGVLAKLIESLSQQVSVLAVKGLPKQYVSAMGSADRAAAVVAQLIGGEASPSELLGKIDHIATTIGHRFIVWVEDLERFAGSATNDEALEHSQRLAPLRALLFGLSEKDSISVVTATVSLHARFDTEKIARFVEKVPLLDPTEAAKILEAFRKRCLSLDFINPAASKTGRFWTGRDDGRALAEALEPFWGNNYSFGEAAAVLCRTPRSLKQALRAALSAWGTLKGEIDSDDLLVMHLLRVGEPAAFAVVERHWGGLVTTHLTEADRNTALDEPNAALDALKLDSDRLAAIRAIINGVFHPDSPSDRPQGLAVRRYWERFISEPQLKPNELDQPVLQVLKADDDDALLDLLESKQSEQVESFARLVSGERLLGLLVPLVRRRKSEKRGDWLDQDESLAGHPPAMIPLWRMLRDLRRADTLARRAICRQLLRAFEVGISNLHLVHELDRFFLSGAEGLSLLQVGETEMTELIERVRSRRGKLLIKHYAGRPDALASALRGAPIWTLHRVVGGSRKVKAGEADLPFPSWGRLAPTIIDACTKFPEIMLPQLAVLVTKADGFSRGVERTEYTFHAGNAHTLFGDEETVLRLFEGHLDTEWDLPAMKQAIQEAVSNNQAQRGNALPLP